MRYFPESALVQLEFDKIKALLATKCASEYARRKAENLEILISDDRIRLQLQQANEYKLLLQSAQSLPHDHVFNLSRELKLLTIDGAVLSGDQLMQIRLLAESIQHLFRWFDADRKMAYPALASTIQYIHYEKAIIQLIDEVLENGQVKDKASRELFEIRLNLFKRRSELRRIFGRIVQKLNKAGYIADIEESFLNGRRVVALFAEHKRQVKGILHGESDTRKTVFIEPEETIEINNEIFALENDENREVYRILKELTKKLSSHADVLNSYHDVLGELDFIRAKARLAQDYSGNLPSLSNKAHLHLEQAYHPLLYLYNKKNEKPTIPVDILLDQEHRILVISGPNAGGKTVTLKTAGLLQLMVQSGLLVPVHPNSEFGIFKQIMIHIGDTQSLEFELSTYSSHLKNMKYFIEYANGKTLFFIDELGSGSDPNLGGAFAEVILQELVRKHAFGIVTTHYLNLKVMAGKTPGIMNGAMLFDEKNLMPQYKLVTGKPGSSYTFSIAERIGLDPLLVGRAKKLVDEDHFKLDKLLNRTEQEMQKIDQERKELQHLMKENERLKTDLQQLINKEKHHQQIELLKQQNRITEERLNYLRDMERKLKQLVVDWRKANDVEDKDHLIRQIQALLFRQSQKQINDKAKKKISSKYREVGGELQVGKKVLMKSNHQVGDVREIRGKKAVVQVGLMPITVDVDNLVLVADAMEEEPRTKEPGSKEDSRIKK